MSDKKFSICEECKKNSGVFDFYKLCCAARHSMKARPVKPGVSEYDRKRLAQEAAKKFAERHGHDYLDMRTMGGELIAFWAGKSGAAR